MEITSTQLARRSWTCRKGSSRGFGSDLNVRPLAFSRDIWEEQLCLRGIYGLCKGNPNLVPTVGSDPESLEGPIILDILVSYL